VREEECYVNWTYSEQGTTRKPDELTRPNLLCDEDKWVIGLTFLVLLIYSENSMHSFVLSFFNDPVLSAYVIQHQRWGNNE